MKMVFLMAAFALALGSSNAGFSQQPQRIDSLTNALQTSKEDTNKVNVLVTLSKYYLLNNPDKALEYAQQTLALSNQLKYKKGVAEAYQNLASHYYYKSDYNKALDYFLKATTIIKEIGNTELLCVAYNDFSALSTDYSTAIDYSDKALALANTLKDSALLKANIYGTKSNIYMAISDYEHSEYYLFKALRLNEKLNSKTRISNNYYNLGRSYLFQGNYEGKALQYIQLSLKTAKEANDHVQVASSLVLIGDVYRNKNKLDSAMQYYTQALDIFQQLGHALGISVSLRDIGLIYNMKGNYDKAKSYVLKAIKLSEQIGDEYSEGNSYESMGQIYMKNNEYKKAIENFTQSLAIAKKTNQETNVSNSLQSLAECAEKMNDYKSYAGYMKQYVAVKDSILKETTLKNSAELEARYNLDKKEKEIALLTQEKEFQQKQFTVFREIFVGGFLVICLLLFFMYRSYHIRQLLKLQTLRAKIASDLHDDIGSTLSSISIFSMVARQQSEEIIPMLDQIGEYSRKMLESMADIVWTINPENDNFEKIILRMRSFAFELLRIKHIDFKFYVDESVSNLKLSMDMRRNLYLIFKEATNNLVKYAEADSAYFSIKNSKNNLTMIIRDNGKGFDITRQSQGNGLKNMKARALEIGAKLLIESESNKGTTIQVLMKAS